MAIVLTIAQRKGGSGKSTLACQLAAALTSMGYDVHGVDADEQASFSEWGARRNNRDETPTVSISAATNFSVVSAIRRARASADYVLVDTPPTTDLVVKQAIRAADIVLTPLQLSPLDLEATMPTAALVGREGKSPLFVINRAPPRARIADKIRAEIMKHQLPLAKSELGNRAAFSESLASGRGVVESAPSSTAAAEINALAQEIESLSGHRRAA